MSDEQPQEKQRPVKWKCPECGQKLTVYIPLSAAPSCNNPEVHPKKSILMVAA